MSNIRKIIASDIKRLTSNVVAIVVIIGLSVIPCLYAWFNIMSNWDPYGAESTKNLPVAVASADAGVEIAGVTLNVGDLVIENLKQNTTIGWVFPDTTYEAVDGVYSGDYYAALVIDESFTEDLISFLGGTLENPRITYYENEKKNAIAPKITSKVKTTVQQEIDKAFVSTLAKVLIGASDYLTTTGSDGNIGDLAVDKLEDLDSDLQGVILILDSYISLMDSTENLMTAGSAVSDQIDSLMESAKTVTDSAKTTSSSMQTIVNSNTAVIISSLGTISTNLDSFNNSLNSLSNTIDTTSQGVTISGTGLQAMAIEQYAAWYEIYSIMPDVQKRLWETNINAINANYTALLGDDFIADYAVNKNKNYPLTKGDLVNLINAAKEGQTDITVIRQKAVTDSKNCLDAIGGMITQYNTYVKPQLESSYSQVENSLKEIEKLLDYKTTDIDSVAAILKTYPDLTSTSKESLLQARGQAMQLKEKLEKLIDDLKEMESDEQYAKIMDLLKNDPEALAEFLSSPVSVTTENVYGVDTNGSATAPFYIILSIWVGALIMSTILKTKVKNVPDLVDVKNWQCFFARYATTFVIGQIQTLITVLGAVFYVGVQCKNLFLFWLACSVASTVFSFLLYSFTYSFGNVGEALSVVLMVIQVAGAGGTFPIEVAPKVFQYLYKFMPFNYAMNALRECIGGFYKLDYLKNLLCLLPFVALAMVNGLLLYYPCLRLNSQIEKSKEKTGILL